MKEIDTWDAMQLAFKHYKKDSITVGELNQWSNEHQMEHTDTYLYICRDDIHHEHDCKRIYWEIVHQGHDLLHKQESIICPVCEVNHYKYPDVEMFEKIVEMRNLVNLLRKNLKK
jgi:hypothetical protein